MNLTKSMMTLAVAAMALPAAAAHAETKPTFVVVHRNVGIQTDETNWNNLALGLSSAGYRVVSVALKPNETATESRDKVAKLLDESPEFGKLVLVGTAAASDVLSQTAEVEASRVNALVYVSAEPAVATLGPRNVAEPSDLVGRIPSYQIKITDKKRNLAFREPGANLIRVREEGHSTLARQEDMVEALDRIASEKHKTAKA
jgi:membrane-associated protease RseP (regulator of RpoE activity)